MRILVAGDYRPDNRVTDIFTKKQYDKIFGEVRKITELADYSIVNMECPVVKGDSTPIAKMGPNLRCDENGVEAIKWAGFDCLTLANNHFYDHGDVGVRNTISAIEKYNLDCVGGGTDMVEASRILYKEINGAKLAVINCCEHEFSIATDSHGGSNALNPIGQFYAIREARSEADYVLVIVHGGHEHWRLPSPRMVETYRFFVDAGADAVINHHQHCYSGFEVYQDRPIFYGLGNFYYYWSESDRLWEEGYMVSLNFDGHISFNIIPYVQSSKDHTIKILESNAFYSELNKLNDIIENFEMLKKKTDEYYSKKSDSKMVIFSPLKSSLFKRLHKRVKSPFMNEEWRLRTMDYIMCESHRDIIISNLDR